MYNVHIYLYYFFFFFNDTATTEIYTLSLHDALPICSTRSSSSKSSGNFRGRRYGLARSGRKTIGGRPSSFNATRTPCWKNDSAPAYRQEGPPVLSVLRQKHHGRRPQGGRGSADRPTSAGRSHYQ